MGADRATEALKRNLAEVFELEAFAEAQFSDGVRYQDLFGMRVSA